MSLDKIQILRAPLVPIVVFELVQLDYSVENLHFPRILAKSKG